MLWTFIILYYITRKKETELNEVTLKLAHSQSYILKLKKRINELEKSKNICSDMNSYFLTTTVTAGNDKIIKFENRLEVMEANMKVYE